MAREVSLNEALRFAACAAAPLVAVAAFRGEAAGARRRLVLGLCAGGALAWLGDAALFAGAGPPRPMGASLLFVPVGVLLCAPWREALAVLPLAFAVARLGCLGATCCYADAAGALPEIAAFVLLHFAVGRAPSRSVPLVLGGLGAIRLASAPLRLDPLPAPFVDPAWIAGGWLVAGVLLRERIGSVVDVRPSSDPRHAALLRALALVFAVGGVLALAGSLVPSPRLALPVGAYLGLGLVLAGGRRPGARLLAASALPLLLLDAHAAALLLVVPLLEELLYRERLLGALRDRFGPVVAVVGSSALFAAAHLDPRALASALAGGLVCGALVLRTGSLALAVGLHAGWNGLALARGAL
ncbi:MAG: CPBP family intramembrane glutamic endopeptidase [Myxococcota bacterium]